MNATYIGHSDASQNYEKMGTEFILPLLFDANIDILLCKNYQGLSFLTYDVTLSVPIKNSFTNISILLKKICEHYLYDVLIISPLL
jgi:hypothetical protein